jgi:Xaa-Pro aminopeptidase
MFKMQRFALSIVIILSLVGQWQAAFGQDASVYEQRRERLLAQMDDGVAIFRNHALAHRSNDGDYAPFRVNSDFYYLTGYEEPECVLVLSPQGPFSSALYVEPKNAHTSQWFGDLPGIEGAIETLGVDTAFAKSEFENHLRRILFRADKVYFDFSDETLFDLIQSALGQMYGRGPAQLMDIRSLVHEMRVFKDEEEISLLRKAINITCEAQIEAMKAIEPNVYEYEIESIYSFIFEKNGAEAKSFAPIIASGPNATVFHYEGLRRKALDGEMLLMDMGAEYYNYAADVTRVVPVNLSLIHI